MIFKVRYKTAGKHVHCRLFVAQAKNRTYAPAGDFVLRPAEFDHLRTHFEAKFVEVYADITPKRPWDNGDQTLSRSLGFARGSTISAPARGV